MQATEIGPVDGAPPRDRPGILVGLEVLLVDDPDAPRPLAEAATALERLGWIGRTVVLAGERIAGRRLPEVEADRIAWVRLTLDRPDLAVAVFEEPPTDRAGDGPGRAAVEPWLRLRDTWQAASLVTSDDRIVGPAHQAGLAVIQIGPGRTDGAPAVERADHQARDLLDAVNQLLVTDTFDAAR